MLEIIRSRLTGWVGLALIGLIGLGLVVSFGNMDSGINPDAVVAEVNGEKISVQEFRQGVDAQVQRYQNATGQDVPPFLRAQMEQGVIEGIINSRLLLQYVTDAGYRVSDRAVAEAIRSLPVFQVDGEFSQQTYEALLLSRGLNPQLFEEDRRRALQTQQLQAAIISSAFVTPADYRRFLELEAQTRDISYATFEAASFEASVEVTEEQIATYYQENAAQFETEESVDVEFVELRLSEVSAKIVVDEEDVRKYYEENIDRYRTEDELKASHILIATDESSDEEALNLANDLLSRINAGEDFAALAAEYSADPGSAGNGGDLGWTTPGVFVPEFEAALFELSVGEVSAPVKTGFGYHLIKLTEKRPGEVKQLADVQESLKAELAENEAEDIFYSQSERLDDLSLESLDGLAPVAEDMELELNSVAAVSRAGAAGLPVSEPLINALYSLEVLEDGGNTPLIEIEPGHVVVARVVTHNLPQQRPLEEVGDSIESFLMRQESARLASESADALSAAVTGGQSLSNAAEAQGVAVESKQGVSRMSQDIPQELVQAAFAAPKPDAGIQPDPVFLANGGVIVFAVDVVTPGNPAELSREERDARKVQLTQLVGQTQLIALVQNLRDTSDVRIFEEVMQGDDVTDF